MSFVAMYPNPTKGKLNGVFSDDPSCKQIKVLDWDCFY